MFGADKGASVVQHQCQGSGMQGSCQEGQRRGEGHIGYPDGVRLFTLWGEGWIWRVDMKVISLEMVMEAMGVNEIP